MTAGLVIRKAELEDAAAVALLLTELNETVGVGGYPSPECYSLEFTTVTAMQMTSRLQRTASVETVLLAEVEGAPAGFTALRMVPYLDQETPYAEVTQVHVRPAFRREKVGVALVEEAERLAVAAGATCVHIMTTEDNLRAQAFYRAMGYEMPCVEFEKFFSLSAVLEGRPVNA